MIMPSQKAFKLISVIMDMQIPFSDNQPTKQTLAYQFMCLAYQFMQLSQQSYIINAQKKSETIDSHQKSELDCFDIDHDYKNMSINLMINSLAVLQFINSKINQRILMVAERNRKLFTLQKLQLLFVIIALNFFQFLIQFIKCMKLIQILPILLTILNAHAVLVIDPMNLSCIDNKISSSQYNQRLAVNLTSFSVNAFSVASIIVDLRHLHQIPKNKFGANAIYLYLSSINIGTGSQSIINLNDIQGTTNKYDFQTTQACLLAVYFQIMDDYEAYKYLLAGTTSFSVSYSFNRIPRINSSFIFFVKSEDNINLAKNKPVLDNQIYFSYQNSYIDSTSSSDSSTTDSTTYWSNMATYAVPFVPYITNCTSYGDMLFISQILQDINRCNLIPIQSTVTINEFQFGSSAVADTCSVQRACHHSGQVQKTQYPAWQTLKSTINLFSISALPILENQYKLDMELSEQDLVPCIITSSNGDNSSSQFPLKVKMSLGYYQFSQSQKRMIQCSIQYSLYVDSTADFKYQIQIESAPLNHTDILLSFGFKWYVYMIVFLIIGIISNIQHFVLWLYHYCTAEVRKSFRIKIYLRVFLQVIKGTFGALSFYLIAVFLVSIIMNAKIFNTYLYDNTTGFSSSPRVIWDYMLQNPVKNYDSPTMRSYRSGRTGLAFIVIGCYIILTTSKFFIGRQKQKQGYNDYQILGRIFKPLKWNRGKFLFGTFFYVFLQFFFIYFAYSTLFSENIWVFIVTMKIIQIILQEITKSVYEDILPCLPFKILTDITAYLNTLSASNFYDFLFSFLVDVAMTMIQKAYVAQLQNKLVDKIKQKSDDFNKFYLNLMNDDDQDVKQKEINLQQIEKSQDNQRVFIYRQAHEVQLLQEEVKEEYNSLSQQSLIRECKANETQKKWKNKYFQSLQKQFNKQTKSKNNKFKEKDLNQNSNSNQLDDQKRQQEKRKKSQKQSQIFQIITDNIALLFTFFVQPFVVLVFWLTFAQSAILPNYGITFNTVILYLLSALVIGVFSVLNIILIFHLLQNYYNIQFKDQILSLLLRFQQRKTYWKADDSDINKDIQQLQRGADHYCLSSQFFFILTVYVGAMIFVILGILIIFESNYNFLDDVATIPITIFWIFLTIFCVFLGKKLLQKVDIWNFNKFSQSQQQEGMPKKKGKNMLAIQDQYYIGKEQSELKTQNKMMSDQLTSFNLISNSNMESHKILQDQRLLSIKNIKKKNYMAQNLKIQRFGQKDDIRLAEKRLQTICQKLKPLFLKQAFKIQYSKKNRNYIKQNIQKILPLVDFLPQLQDFKDLDSNKKIQDKNKKDESKSGDPLIGQMLLRWLKVTQLNRQKRIANGLEIQSKPKKCSFCYSGSWGLYYGYGGICLQCSKKLTQIKNRKMPSKKLIQNERQLQYISEDRIIEQLDEQQQDHQSQNSKSFFSFKKKKI